MKYINHLQQLPQHQEQSSLREFIKLRSETRSDTRSNLCNTVTGNKGVFLSFLFFFERSMLRCTERRGSRVLQAFSNRVLTLARGIVVTLLDRSSLDTVTIRRPDAKLDRESGLLRRASRLINRAKGSWSETDHRD